MPSGGPEHFRPNFDALPYGLFDSREFSARGIVDDYRNAAVMPVILFIADAIHEGNPLEIPLKDTLGKVKTYSEYLGERLDQFNQWASKRKKRKANKAHVLQLLVTNIPQASDLDVLAAELRLLAETDLTEEQLVEPTIRIVAAMEDIMAGKERKDRILDRFGLSGH